MKRPPWWAAVSVLNQLVAGAQYRSGSHPLLGRFRSSSRGCGVRSTESAERADPPRVTPIPGVVGGGGVLALVQAVTGVP
jgi:hypothetical protein